MSRSNSLFSCLLPLAHISCFIWLQVVGTLFTHHQKCVIVDSQASGNNRKITAFLGGLDLCDGRYDTPEHRLFCDLDTVFEDDFHNPTFSVSISSIKIRFWGGGSSVSKNVAKHFESLFDHLSNPENPLFVIWMKGSN